MKLIVITGGPGAGKTTVISLLRNHGYPVCPEAARAIIQDQTAIGGPALPWIDPAMFAELMLCWEIRSYHWAQQQTGPVFFDQSLVGLPGYLRKTGRAVPSYFETAVAAFRYHPRAFVGPPWPEIYRNDNERRQTVDEAKRVYEDIVDEYARYGYELVELPRTAPPDRVRFILQHTLRR